MTPTSVRTTDRHASWRDGAACRNMDPETFFASEPTYRDTALATCHTCPVRTPCLEHALTTRERHGIWGGTDEHQRERLLRSGRRVA